MNYKPAVEAALKGDDSGFSFLYEVTYRNMYYVALKYLKNEDAAQDVLQDAYLKAWKSLDTLKDPDNFPAWLGRIVANTAKNQLVKKNPVLFSETEQENGQNNLAKKRRGNRLKSRFPFRMKKAVENPQPFLPVHFSQNRRGLNHQPLLQFRHTCVDSIWNACVPLYMSRASTAGGGEGDRSFLIHAVRLAESVLAAF